MDKMCTVSPHPSLAWPVTTRACQILEELLGTILEIVLRYQLISMGIFMGYINQQKP
jgi:hypothetical protein